jgi:hypothetical protein
VEGIKMPISPVSRWTWNCTLNIQPMQERDASRALLRTVSERVNSSDEESEGEGAAAGEAAEAGEAAGACGSDVALMWL